nr:reverse transcriptase domain-containing protein [Tanacetum cinerariifolium]
MANPRGDVKTITTQSGVSYDGPTIPPTSSLLKEVEREIEATKDKVQTTSLESTAHIQPSVVQVPIIEPDVAPKPNPKPFTDALLHIPKFAFTFKSLLSNKEKLFKLANTPLTENCSAILLKKLPKKLEDPRRFLIPCDFQGLESCMALADLGKFIFPADFVVVNYNVDPRIPLILGRPFLKTARALVDVHKEELILRDGDEKLIFHTNSTSKHLHKHENDTTSLSDSSLSLTLFETSDSLLEEFTDELALIDPFPSVNKDNNFDFKANLREIEFLLNQDPSTESNIETIIPILKKFIDEPSLDYLPPPGDDDDDLFDLKSYNDEWKKILYGDCYKDIDSKKDKNKDSKMKLLIVEAHIVESNDLLL